MSAYVEVKVSLPAELVGEIREAVSCGDYTCTTELFLDVLYDWLRARKGDPTWTSSYDRRSKKAWIAGRAFRPTKSTLNCEPD